MGSHISFSSKRSLNAVEEAVSYGASKENCVNEFEMEKHYVTYKLLGEDRRFYQSKIPGALGGYRRNKIYGRLDCPSALRAIIRGGYAKYRVFFENEKIAIAAAYRPCAICLPEQYARWKSSTSKGGDPLLREEIGDFG